MAQRITISVTQEHIDRAIASNSHYCALSEAVKDALPHAKRVSSDLATIRYTDGNTGKRYIHLTAVKCAEYLLMLDDGKRGQMKPFKFLLNRPMQVIEAREGRPKKPTITKSKTHAPVKRNGKAPPMGPLAGGALGGVGSPDKLRIGSIRRFGLRSMGRSK